MDKLETKYKILIIEDNKDLVSIMKAFLENNNFSVNFAYGGKAGLSEVKKDTPDLIMLDIIMPDMDGRDVLIELKKDPSTKEIPVIIITGKEEQFDRSYLIELGAYEYFTKPYDRYNLLRQINNIFDKKAKGIL